MNVKVINKINLEGIPSASGIEIVNDLIYIISDDSPYLYCLDFNFKLIEKVELFTTNDFITGRIPKKIKPDLESLTRLEINGKKYLLTAGSGSKSLRKKAFLIELSAGYPVKEIDLSGIYDYWKSEPTITDNLPLNIEGLATDQKRLFFFNRTNNAIIMYSLKDFISFIFDTLQVMPIPEVIKLDLKGIDTFKAGLSGADIFDGKIFFTTSVEDTDDPVLDGKVYGSFCGCVDSEKLIPNETPEISTYHQIEEENSIFTGKVESIAVYQKISNTEFTALCVTDDDLGGSELLVLSIIL